MKDQEISLTLTRILENLDTIPTRPEKFNDTPKLSTEEKRSLMDKVKRFNEYGKTFEAAEGLVKTANDLAEIAKLGKTYAMNEDHADVHRNIINRDFKNLDGIVREFTKLSKECYGGLQQLRVLYEDMGQIVQRYYEIQDINPTSGKSSHLDPDEVPEEEIVPNEAPTAINLSELAP